MNYLMVYFDKGKKTIIGNVKGGFSYISYQRYTSRYVCVFFFLIYIYIYNHYYFKFLDRFWREFSHLFTC
jgi:hypothetical protein